MINIYRTRHTDNLATKRLTIIGESFWVFIDVRLFSSFFYYFCKGCRFTHGELCEHLCAAPLVCGWAAPLIADGGRADTEGLAALEAALRIRRAVGCGPDAVRRFQASKGLAADGIVGPRTLAALGLSAPT
jgi:hypothetical protein